MLLTISTESYSPVSGDICCLPRVFPMILFSADIIFVYVWKDIWICFIYLMVALGIILRVVLDPSHLYSAH